MANELKQYFPLLGERKEVLQEIQDHEELLSIFESWTEFILLPLDIYLKNLHNRGISNELDAWLAFFSTDDPEYIAYLCEHYPMFREMYEEVYELCRNVEQVINMFSKELMEFDQGTVQYMIDEMQGTINEQKGMLEGQRKLIDEQKGLIEGQQDGAGKIKGGSRTIEKAA